MGFIALKSKSCKRGPFFWSSMENASQNGKCCNSICLSGKFDLARASKISTHLVRSASTLPTTLIDMGTERLIETIKGHSSDNLGMSTNDVSNSE